MAARASAARAERARADGAERTERPVEITGATMLQAQTLKGDIRDQILDLVKALTKPWSAMKEHEQRTVIEDVTLIAGILTNESVRITASRGFEHYEAGVTGYKLDAKLGIVVTIAVPNTDEALVAINQCRFQSVLFVPHSIKSFHGEKAPAVADAGRRPPPKPDAKPDAKPAPTGADGTPVAHDPQTGEWSQDPSPTPPPHAGEPRPATAENPDIANPPAEPPIGAAPATEPPPQPMDKTATERAAENGQKMPGDIGPMVPDAPATEPELERRPPAESAVA